jgi:hypothetical protein
LVPLLFMGLLKVHSTPKSEQFWHRLPSSLVGLHRILRLWQKSQAREIRLCFFGVNAPSDMGLRSR